MILQIVFGLACFALGYWAGFRSALSWFSVLLDEQLERFRGLD